jgi:hypothetical protein
MPKVYGTRKERAAELFARLKRGPTFYDIGIPENPKIAYKRWVETWILEEAQDLIPELKKLKEKK